MKEEVRENRFTWKKWFIFILLIGILCSIWFLFFNYDKCIDKTCFYNNLKSCDKASFTGGGDMIFEYIIKGVDKDKCEVDVRLLQGELDNSDSKKIEGQIMTCMLPLGAAMNPESDISVCHGLLKEGLQDLVIRKLHTYLVQNLGRLNLEVVGLPKEA